MLLGEWLLAYLDNKYNRVKVARRLTKMGIHKKHYKRNQRKTKKRMLKALSETADTIKYSLDNPVRSGNYPSTTVQLSKYYAGWSGNQDTEPTYELELYENGEVYSVMGIPFQELYNLKVEHFEVNPIIFADIWWDLTFDGWTIKSQSDNLKELSESIDTTSMS